MTSTRRIFSPFLFLVCIAFILALPAHAAPDSAAITREEWAAYLRQSPALKASDVKLNATYKKAMASLSQTDKRKLLNDQRTWITSRNQEAFSKYAKGSSAYLDMLAAASIAREEALREQYQEKPSAQLSEKSRNAEAAPVVTPETMPGSKPVASVKRTISEPAVALEKKPGASEKKIAAPSPAPSKKEAAKAAPDATTADELVVKVPAQKTRRNIRKIDITPKRFAGSYNALALGFRAPLFPLVPANVASYDNNRTESSPVTDGISMQFKYTNGAFDRPETITFLAHNFVGGTTEHRDNIAYALVGLLKSLNQSPVKDDKTRDAEIYGFMRSINNAFTSDTSRVWKNEGLVYVITYLKKSDLFAMVVNADEKQKR